MDIAQAQLKKELAAVTDERDEARAESAGWGAKYGETVGRLTIENARLRGLVATVTKERDDARANTWHINKDREGFIAENARLRTELDTAREWADGRVASAYAERDAALGDVDNLRILVDRTFATGGEVLAENASLRAAIAPTPGNVRIVASHLPWSAEISVCQGEEYAVEILRAIAARAGVKL